MMKKKTGKILFLATVCAMLLIPAVSINREAYSVSDMDNRVLTYAPEFNIRYLDAFMAGLNDYVNDRIGFREQVLSSYQIVEDKLFHYLAHPLYEYGKDDWIMTKEWDSIQTFHLDLEEGYADRFAALMKDAQEISQEHGADFMFWLITNKETVYPEYMPSFEVYDSYKRVPRLYDHIKANSSVKIAFPKAELKNITRYYDSYYRYDSHWNYVGSFIGVQAMYGLLGMPQTDIMSLEVTKESLPASGDLIILGGLNSSDYPSFYEYTVHYKDWIHTTWETEEPVLLNESIYKTEADCGNDTRFVMVGDSYRNYMVKYIKKDFDHCTFVHREHFLEAKDDILAANVLVLESAERYDYKSLADMENLIQLFSSTDQ